MPFINSYHSHCTEAFYFSSPLQARKGGRFVRHPQTTHCQSVVTCTRSTARPAPGWWKTTTCMIHYSSSFVHSEQINRAVGDGGILGTHGTRGSHGSMTSHAAIKAPLVPANPVCILIQQCQVTRETAACSLCKYLKP